MKYPLIRVFDKQLQLTVAAILFGLVVAIVLYVRARNAPVAALNPHGNTGSFFYDFMMGRELNPRFGRLDVKFLLLRSSLIATVSVARPCIKLPLVEHATSLCFMAHQYQFTMVTALTLIV